jgi:hypothetical protein
MNIFKPHWRWTILLTGLVTAGLGGFYFFHVSAQTEKFETPTVQNLVNGRLVFIRQVTQQSQQQYIETSDADGSNRFTFDTGALSMSRQNRPGRPTEQRSRSFWESAP